MLKMRNPMMPYDESSFPFYGSVLIKYIITAMLLITYFYFTLSLMAKNTIQYNTIWDIQDRWGKYRQI